MNEQLRISEIFCSLQGEAKYTGIPSVFIRLTGCPLRCGYCDTEYAFSGGKKLTIAEILDDTESYRVKHVTVTGGEPLAQPNCNALLQALLDNGYVVSLETSGALDVSEVPHAVHKVVDIKTPGSKEVIKNRYENLDYINEHDQIKFVICDRGDYDWSKDFMQKHRLNEQCEVIFSPSYGQMDTSDLANWIVADKLPVRFQIQLHKILWGDKPGV